MKDTIKILKWVTGALEFILAIPFFGVILSISSLGIVPFIMISLHIITLVLAYSLQMSAKGNILGIGTAFVSWIPLIGMSMHFISAVSIMIGAYRTDEDF